MQGNVYLYLLIMAGVTYLVRVLPLTLIRREIRNRFVRSFLYYVPYVTLAVMTFPAIIQTTGSTLSGALALGMAVVLAWFGCGLIYVAAGACVTVLLLSFLV